jgi:ABC-type multidrug transport system ATPase subunit
MASIRTAGLTKDFGDLRAVSEIDLDLPEGGVTGFVGPNGAGKSTTIRMLLGLITPTRGDGEVLGHPIERPAAYLHRVGALIEAPAFYPTLTGKANLQVFARLGGHDRGRILAQALVHVHDLFGYERWYLFDDRWAAGHPELAASLLRYAGSWDPLGVTDGPAGGT